MSSKEYLRQYRYIKMQLESLRESCEMAYSLLVSCGIDPSNEHLSGSGGNAQERALVRYLEYKDKLEKKCDELMTLKKEIEAVIEAVREPVLRVLLRKYYIDGRNWEQTSEAIGYSVRWTIKRLHPDALHAVEEIRKKFK